MDKRRNVPGTELHIAEGVATRLRYREASRYSFSMDHHHEYIYTQAASQLLKSLLARFYVRTENPLQPIY